MAGLVGGQAVVEGVMMRSGGKVVTVCRKGRRLLTHKTQLPKSSSWQSIPFVRGVVRLAQMTVLGYKELIWSVEQQEDETVSTAEAAITLTISLALAIALFVGLPYWLSTLFAGPKTVGFHVIDGLFRLGTFIAYLVIIGQWEDMRRIFMYHGAEHKAVNCYEAGKKLTVANCQEQPTFHPRCGTSLLIYVVIIAIVAFAVLRTHVWYLNVALRIVLIPLIAALAYECVMFMARYIRNPFVSFLATPGRWTQELTVREPNPKQIEVALAALRKAL